MSRLITIYGADWCPDCIRAKRYFSSHDIPYTYIDLVATPGEKETAKKISGKPNIPVIVYPDGSILVEPSDEDLAKKVNNSI